MEAQRLSLAQVHAAQLELLQEESEALTHSLELKLQQQSRRGDPGEEIHHSVTGPLSLPVAVNLDCCIYVNPCFGSFQLGQNSFKVLTSHKLSRKNALRSLRYF